MLDTFTQIQIYYKLSVLVSSEYADHIGETMPN